MTHNFEMFLNNSAQNGLEWVPFIGCVFHLPSPGSFFIKRQGVHRVFRPVGFNSLADEEDRIGEMNRLKSEGLLGEKTFRRLKAERDGFKVKGRVENQVKAEISCKQIQFLIRRLEQFHRHKPKSYPLLFRMWRRQFLPSVLNLRYSSRWVTFFWMLGLLRDCMRSHTIWIPGSFSPFFGWCKGQCFGHYL